MLIIERYALKQQLLRKHNLNGIKWSGGKSAMKLIDSPAVSVSHKLPVVIITNTLTVLTGASRTIVSCVMKGRFKFQYGIIAL